jgi:cell division protein FtsB
MTTSPDPTPEQIRAAGKLMMRRETHTTDDLQSVENTQRLIAQYMADGESMLKQIGEQAKRIAELEARLEDERATVRSFHDGYHAIAGAFGIGVGDTNDEDLAHRVKCVVAQLAAVSAVREKIDREAKKGLMGTYAVPVVRWLDEALDA